MDEGEMGRASTQRIKDVFQDTRRVFSGEVLKRLRTYDWNKEIIPGVTAVGTPGHSPGHTSYVVSSGANALYVQVDVAHAPFLFVRNPGWHPFYDHDPLQAEATRYRVYDMLAAEKMLVQGFHYPFPSLAHIEKTRTGYRELPL
jgi:glyoxylase-like metal-dependent hydrolase (beta-lactamase superfamily II)